MHRAVLAGRIRRDRRAHQAASALCCTSDLTLAEFKTLEGQDGRLEPQREDAAGVPGRHRNWRTDLYCDRRDALTHKESIQLIKSLGAKFTPELKGPNRSAKLQVEAVFGSQAAYAQAMIDDYKAAGIPPKDVWAQSFNLDDVLYWIQHEPEFGKQAVYLDDANVAERAAHAGRAEAYAAQGMKIVGAAHVGAARGRERQDRAVADAGTPRPRASTSSPGRSSGRAASCRKCCRPRARQPVVLLPDDAGRPRNDGDIMVYARRAGQAGRHPRHLLRLVGDGDVLRQLHGPEVTADRDGPSLVPALLPDEARPARQHLPKAYRSSCHGDASPASSG